MQESVSSPSAPHRRSLLNSFGDVYSTSYNAPPLLHHYGGQMAAATDQLYIDTQMANLDFSQCSSLVGGVSTRRNSVTPQCSNTENRKFRLNSPSEVAGATSQSVKASSPLAAAASRLLNIRNRANSNPQSETVNKFLLLKTLTFFIKKDF